MKICFVRHGETDWNLAGKFQGLEDIPLNQTGIAQIKDAADYLKKSAWHEIISSPLARAKKSAEIIREKTGLGAVHVEAGFVERDLGKLSGMTKEEANMNFPGGNYEGMEAEEALQSRTVNALLKWIKIFDGKNIVIVSHGAAIHAMLTKWGGDKIVIGQNASISLLEKNGDTMKVVFYNKSAEELLPALP